MRVDLNADLGESALRWASGEDRRLLDVVTSANVCCGAYAGDDDLILETCAAALHRGIAIGAQVGYRDRAGFGRVPMDMAPADLTAEVTGQILHLEGLAQSVGAEVTYVKPHGALYNTIVADETQALAVVEAIAATGLPLLGLPGSAALGIAASQGLTVVSEGFADRAYTEEGTLVPRNEPGALLTGLDSVAAQTVRLLRQGVGSICVHSDSPGALNLARAVRQAITETGAAVKRFT